MKSIRETNTTWLARNNNKNRIATVENVIIRQNSQQGIDIINSVNKLNVEKMNATFFVFSFLVLSGWMFLVSLDECSNMCVTLCVIIIPSVFVKMYHLPTESE